MSDVRTIVTFQSSAFNTSEPRDYFINDCCYGDDLSRWFIAELRARGVQAETEPDQEDFGWYFGFRVGNTDYQLVLGYRPGLEKSEDVWIGGLERKLGFVKSLLGRRRHGIRREAACVLHEVLSSSPSICHIRWHDPRDFDAGEEENGRATPAEGDSEAK